MATVTKVIDICDRCSFGQEKDASTTRRFSVDGNAYILKLCEKHGQMFDRDLLGWTRYGIEDQFHSTIRMPRSKSFFTEDEREQARSAALLREEQQRQDAEVRELVSANGAPIVAERPLVAEVHHNPLADKWVITEHAKLRLRQRGYGLDEVLEAAEHPQNSYGGSPKHGGDARIHQLGECAVVCVPARHVIISVLHRNEARYAETAHRSELERIAQ